MTISFFEFPKKKLLKMKIARFSEWHRSGKRMKFSRLRSVKSLKISFIEILVDLRRFLHEWRNQNWNYFDKNDARKCRDGEIWRFRNESFAFAANFAENKFTKRISRIVAAFFHAFLLLARPRKTRKTSRSFAWIVWKRRRSSFFVDKYHSRRTLRNSGTFWRRFYSQNAEKND